MRNSYKWYVDRKYIERESEKAILLNISIFKFWIPKKLVIKQEFALKVSIYLFSDTKFKDLTTNQEIGANVIIEHFRDSIQETNKSKVETKASMYKQEYKQNIKNNYQQTLNNTYQANNQEEDFETPKWEFNEEDLI